MGTPLSEHNEECNFKLCLVKHGVELGIIDGTFENALSFLKESRE